MKIEKIKVLGNQLDKMIAQIYKSTKSYKDILKKVDSRYLQSAKNLIHYQEFRKFDTSRLKKKLNYLGFSKLSRTEGNILASLITTRGLLRYLAGGKNKKVYDPYLSIKRSEKLRGKNANALLGASPAKRNARIMVTLPSEAAYNQDLVAKMIKSGMDNARINCAHDDKATWKMMIDNVSNQGKKLGKNVKIFMDLGGPKIRTGPLKRGPEVIKFKPTKDLLGKVDVPLEVLFIDQNRESKPHTPFIPIPLALINSVKTGDVLSIRDSRNKKREFIIKQKGNDEFVAELYATSFISSGLELKLKRTKINYIIGSMPKAIIGLKLNIGDTLVLNGKPIIGENKIVDKNGKLIRHAHVSCTLPEVVDYIKKGETILFDDGQIKGVVRALGKQKVYIKITNAKAGGSNLNEDKGINLPHTDLPISGLTKKDKEDLKFVVKYADVINFSFVNTVKDVQDLLNMLKKYKVAKDKIGLILKIETAKGFKNLPDIILTAMQIYPIGVMIARGDLAVECGWEKLGILQHEIMRVSESAHIPDIWATQVLENLAKKGIPNRSEITDVTIGERTDCIMLNKGPYISEVMSLIDKIYSRIKLYEGEKNTLASVIES